MGRRLTRYKAVIALNERGGGRKGRVGGERAQYLLSIPIRKNLCLKKRYVMLLKLATALNVQGFGNGFLSSLF